MNEDDCSARTKLQRTFTVACAREGVRAVLRESSNGLDAVFEDQDGAPGDLIRHHFGLELAAAGVRADEIERLASGLPAPELARLGSGLDTAIRRIRILLIEHNAYMSGGLPWVFGSADPVLVSRGLSIYRFPKLAAVEVCAVGAAIRISFAPGDLGPVTSSGFYVPTRIAGEFTATIRYELGEWQPGPATAALALFAQDEPSLHRYYSQRNSEAEPAGHAVLAHLNELLLPGRAVTTRAGWFRITRSAGVVRAWHRAGDAAGFELLGELAGQPEADLYLGAKVWSMQRSGGLRAEFSGLEIVGRVSPRQPPPPDERPDPRVAKES